ncbi:MAG: hypothetical protein IPN76_06705 [Saprospiraceae bacterium]|nr:hypothetical protein [Saprospiraceae bacterium]
MGRAKAIREVMSFLMQHEISPTYAQKVFKTHGEESIAVLQENPTASPVTSGASASRPPDKTAQNSASARRATCALTLGWSMS